MKASILSELGDIWKWDHTYACVSNVAFCRPGTRTLVRPFSSFCAVMNGHGIVMWYGFQATENAWDDLLPHMTALLQRHRDWN